MKDSQRKAMFAKIKPASKELEQQAIRASKSKLKNGDRVIIVGHKGMNGSTGKLRFTDTRYGGKGYGSVSVKHEKGGGRSMTDVWSVRLSTSAERKKADDNDAEILRIIKK